MYEQQIKKIQELQHGEASYLTFAKREVMLCAGTFQSPQPLECSGIGDPKVFTEARIPCVVQNSDVGNNLQKHTMSAAVYEMVDGILSSDSMFRDPELLKEHQNLYAEKQMSGSVSFMGYISYSSQVSKPELDEIISILSIPSFINEQSPPQNHSFQRKRQDAIAASMCVPSSADVQIVGTPTNFDTAKDFSDCT